MKAILIITGTCSILFCVNIFSVSAPTLTLYKKNTAYSNGAYTAPPPSYFIKFSINNVPFTTRFIDAASPDYQQLFLKYRTDSTIAIRTFEKTSDSIVIAGGFATFQFDFHKNSSLSDFRQVYFYTDTKFVWAPKEYTVADFDLDDGINHAGYDGLAEYRTHGSRLLSYQYSWVAHHRPAKFTVTSIDRQSKFMTGTFSYTATYTEATGNTIPSQKNTYAKVIEADITDGKFCLPYTIIAVPD